MKNNLPPEGPRWEIPDWNPVEVEDSEKPKPYLDQLDEIHELRQQLDELKKSRNKEPEKEADSELNEETLRALVIKLDTMARRKPPLILRDEDINEKFDAIEAFFKKTGNLKTEITSSFKPPHLILRWAAKPREFEANLSYLEVARTHFLRWHGSTAERSAPPPSPKEPGGIINRLIEFYRYPKNDDPEVAHIKAYLGREYIKFDPQGLASETDKNSFEEIELKKLPFDMRILKFFICREALGGAIIGLLIYILFL
jgi:hypothetical protein